MRHEDKKMGFKYCDPLGNDIPSALYRTIKKMTDDTGSTMHYEEYQGQLQHDSYNCGPWIIEYSRCVANEAGYVFPPADINQARTTHLAHLFAAGIRYTGDPTSIAKRKSKRNRKRRSDESPQPTRRPLRLRFTSPRSVTTGENQTEARSAELSSKDSPNAFRP